MSAAAKHIVIFSPGFAASEDDTACLPYLQKYLLAYRNAFPEDRISIIAFQYPSKSQVYTWKGMEIFSAGRNRFFPLRFITWIRVLRRFRQLNAAMPVTAIHSFWLHECAFLGQYVSGKYGIKHIATMMGQDNKKGNPYLKWISPDKTRLISLSEFSSRKLLDNYGMQSDYIIPFGEIRSEIDTSKNARPIDLLGAGPLIPLKNYRFFIEVVMALKKDFPDIKAVIAGNTSVDLKETRLIRELIRNYGLGGNLDLAGFVTDGQMESFMMSSKIFLHPSLYEGQSLVCAEALYCGMTVVRFGAGNIAPRKTIVCKNQEEMVSAVKKLLNDRTLTFESYIPIKMNETVKSYHSLY